MTALMFRCARQGGSRRGHRPGPRSGRAGACPSSLLPRPGAGCCRGSGRPARAGVGDGPVDPPVWGSGCRSRPGFGPARDRLLAFGACPPRSRARARPCCPAARRTDPAWPAGAARRLGGTKPPNGHRPSSSFRTRAATRAQVRPSGPSRAALPRKDGHVRPVAGTGSQKRTDTKPLGIGHPDMSYRGPSSTNT